MARLPAILNGQGESLVPLSHLQQQVKFLRGAGVDFLPQYDKQNVRKSLIQGIVKNSRLDLRLDAMGVMMTRDGRLALYLRPDGRLYQIQEFSRDNYRIYYDATGVEDSAEIQYCYKARPANGKARDRWVWVRFTRETIESAERDTRFDLDQTITPDRPPVPNTFGFVPIVEVLNPAPASDRLGLSDFHSTTNQIESHDDLLTAVLDNLDYFANSPLVTTRSANEISETAFQDAPRYDPDSVAEASGFRSEEQRANLPRMRRKNRRLKRVIGDIEDGELFEQLQINPVPPDQLGWVDRYEKQLREILGGTTETGLETATETRIMFGGVQANAVLKQKALYTYGICRLFEYAITLEEALYQDSKGQMGLPPIHEDRTVNYRVNPVFLSSSQEVLNRSIVSRNLMRQGVEAKRALMQVFPEMSETELDQMVGSGGLPTEFLTDAIQLAQQLAGLIDPLTGGPLADPDTQLPLVYSVLPFITSALNYGSQFDAIPNRNTAAATAAESGAIVTARIRGLLDSIRRQLEGDTPNGVVSANDRNPLELSVPQPGTTVRREPSTNGGFWDYRSSPIYQSARAAVSRIFARE